MQTTIQEIQQGLQSGTIVPYLGANILKDVKNLEDDSPMPWDTEAMILAMTGGRPMSPRLMYEFPRAAMDQELKRGRNFLEQFLTNLYGKTRWSRAALHDWLAGMQPPYVVDINRDNQLLESYAQVPHLLIQGIARITGTNYRFVIHQYDGKEYHKIEQEQADPSLPILFKPMGCPTPEPAFIASDADYVDYITELMGGFAIPSFLKERRQGKQYLFMGLRLNRDTERMVLTEIVFASGSPTGWALIPEPTDKERKYCSRMGIEVLEMDWQAFLQALSKNEATGASLPDRDKVVAGNVGC